MLKGTSVQVNFLDPQNQMNRIFNSAGKICQSLKDYTYTTFLDKTTSSRKRTGLIRNTSSISHIVVAEKNIKKIYNSGKQKEKKLHNYHVNHVLQFGILRNRATPVEFLQSKTFEEPGDTER